MSQNNRSFSLITIFRMRFWVQMRPLIQIVIDLTARRRTNARALLRKTIGTGVRQARQKTHRTNTSTNKQQWLEGSEDLRAVVKKVTRRHFTVVEAHAARVAFAMGTSIKLAPIMRWDGAFIGDGTPSLAAMVLRELMERDMDPVEDLAGERFTDVPYASVYEAA